MSTQTLAVTPFPYTPTEDPSAITKIRHNFLQLQALVSVVLSYQVLFAQHTVLPVAVQLPAVLGLMMSCVVVMVVPDRWVWSAWFPAALALADTAIVTGLIYKTGSVGSDLYLAYFFILLIATMCKTFKQMFMFFSIVCTVYGLFLYQEFQETGNLLEHHLLRIPLLVVMAVFYGRTVESLRTLSEYDPLTGLPNRPTFVSMVADAMALARRHHDSVAVFFLNLDGFKLINDTLGRRVGDQLLLEVSRRLTNGPARDHTLAREGGDEFAIMATRISSPQHCSLIAEDLIRSLEAPFTLANREIFITTSMGIALFPQDTEDPDGLVRNADIAMSRAKEQGKNTYQFYSAEINTQAHQRLELAHSLRKALDRQELRLFYQPQVELATGHVVGMEALVRWQHPTMGLLSPHQFIPLAEETGLIGPLGQWALLEACRQVSAWHKTGRAKLRMSVNISPRQLNQADLVSAIGRTLDETGLESQYLEVELTETLLLQDKAHTIKTLQALKSLGVGIAIDDFGTGYSSLSYLQRFPIDTLKIDQSFIRDLTTDPDARAIVKAIIGMAQALKLKVIAEGVENEEQIAVLQAEGCEECQGFAFSRPHPAEEILEVLDLWPSRWRTLAPRAAW